MPLVEAWVAFLAAIGMPASLGTATLFNDKLVAAGLPAQEPAQLQKDLTTWRTAIGSRLTLPHHSAADVGDALLPVAGDIWSRFANHTALPAATGDALRRRVAHFQKRSAFMTLVQAAAKSVTNFSFASSSA